MENFVLRLKRLDRDVQAFNEKAERRVRERADSRNKTPAVAGGQPEKKSQRVFSTTQPALTAPNTDIASEETIKRTPTAAAPVAKRVKVTRSASGAMVPVDPLLQTYTPKADSAIANLPSPLPSDRMEAIMRYELPLGLFSPYQTGVLPRRLYPLDGPGTAEDIERPDTSSGHLATPSSPVPSTVAPDAIMAPMPLRSSLPSTEASTSESNKMNDTDATQASETRRRTRGPRRKKNTTTTKRVDDSVIRKKINRKQARSLLSPVSNVDSPRRRILKQQYWGRLQALEAKGPAFLDAINDIVSGGDGTAKRTVPWVDWDAIEACGPQCRHTHLKDVEMDSLDGEEVKKCKEQY